MIPFRVEVPQADLVDLRDRLRRTRWPERETVADWSQGVPLSYLQELCTYWAEGYDWRAAETPPRSASSTRTGWPESTSSRRWPRPTRPRTPT